MDYENGSWWTREEERQDEIIGCMSPDDVARAAFGIIGEHIEPVAAPRPANVACPRCGKPVGIKRANFLQEQKMPCVCKDCASEMISQPVACEQGGELVLSYNKQGQKYIARFLKGSHAIR